MTRADSPSFVEEVLTHSSWVRQLAAKIAGEHLADEYAQEALYRALNSPPRHLDNVRGWLRTVTKNVVLEDQRKKKAQEKWIDRKPEHEFSDVADVPTPDEVTSRNEATRAILDGVHRLDELDRLLILTRYQEGISVSRIAESHNMSEKAVRHRIDRGCERVRKLLAKDHGFDGMLPCLVLAPGVMPRLVEPATAATAATASKAWTSYFPHFATAAVVAVSASILLDRDFGAPLSAASPSFESALHTTSELPEATERVREPAGSENVPLLGSVSTRTFMLRFVEPEGTAASGVPVVAYAESEVVRKAGTQRPAHEIVASAVSDQTGHFQFDLPFDLDAIEIETSSPEYLALGNQGALNLTRDTGSRVIEIELQRAAAAQGRILDPEGLPIQGAQIYSFMSRGPDSRQSGPYATDENGRFAIARIRPSEDHHFLITAPGISPEWVSVPLGQPGTHETDDITIGAGGRAIHGAVLDPRGRPLPDARVYVVAAESLARHAQDLSSAMNRAHAFTITQGKAGEFVCPSVQEGDEIWVSGVPGYETLRSGPLYPDETHLVLQFKKRLPSLKVRAWVNGQPVSEAVVSVSLDKPHGLRNELQLTASEGILELEISPNFAPGSHWVEVLSAHGYAAPMLVEFPRAEVLDVDLRPATRVECTFEDEFGRSWPGLNVSIKRDLMENRGTATEYTATSDSVGRITAQLPPGLYHLHSWTSAGEQIHSKTFEVAGSTIRLEAIAEQGRRQSFDFRSYSGAALASRDVQILHADGSVALNIKTDLNGVGRFTPPSEHYRARLIGGISRHDAPTTEAAPSESSYLDGLPEFVFPDLLDVSVELTGSGFDASDSLLLVGDQSRTMGPRWLEHSQSQLSIAAIDHRLTFESVPAGNYWLVAPATRMRAAAALPIEVSPSKTSFRFELRTGEVKGRIRGDLPNQSLEVEILHPSDGSPSPQAILTAPVAADGSFHLPGVPEGSWALRVRPTELVCSNVVPIQVDPAMLGPDVELALSEASRLMAYVSNSALSMLQIEALSHRAVALLHLESGCWYTGRYGKDRIANRRAAILDGLPAGEYEVWRNGVKQADTLVIGVGVIQTLDLAD